MRHVDAIMFLRWGVASLLMLTPLALGCSAKTDTAQGGLPPNLDQSNDGQPNDGQSNDGRANVAASDVQDPTDPFSPSGPEYGTRPSGTQISDANFIEPAADGPPVSTENDRDIADSDAGTDAGAGSDDADRPRSLFRSIGRALRRGVTDAAGVTSNESNDAEPESADLP